MSVEKHVLSKSTFIKGHQCLKSLYLYKKRPFLRDKLTAEQRAKFKRGHAVGHLAQQLFPGGIDVSPKSPSQYQKAVVNTQQLIAQGQQVIYEATFQYQGVLVMLDILRKTEEGWVAYEVKSSKKLSDTYYTDAALQHYVITQSGLPLVAFFLVYVDSAYRRDETLDLHSLFKFEEVSQIAADKKAYVAEQIEAEKAILRAAHSPKIAVGEHCFVPYKCDFVGFCWKKIADKTYLPPPLAVQTLPKSPKAQRTLSLSLRQQVVPLCSGQHAYSYQLMAYATEATKVQICGQGCEAGQAFVAQFFTQVSADKHTYLVYDKTVLDAFLDDMLYLYPSYQPQIDSLKHNTVGLLELLEAAELIQAADRHKFKWPYWQKLLGLSHQIQLKPIASDAEALLLYDKAPNLLSDEDDNDLERYLKNKFLILEAMRQHIES